MGCRVDGRRMRDNIPDIRDTGIQNELFVYASMEIKRDDGEVVTNQDTDVTVLCSFSLNRDRISTKDNAELIK